MSTIDDWLDAYQLTEGDELPGPTLDKPTFVPAEVVAAYAGGFPRRWASLLGCRIQVLGRGFADILRVADVVLWVQFEVASDATSGSVELETVIPKAFVDGTVARVKFPPGSRHVLVHAAVIREKLAATPKPPPPPPVTLAPPPVLPSKVRAAAIREFCQERGVECLVHFTRAENLPHILQHGLVSRTQVDKWRVENGSAFPVVCDEERWDNHPNAVCVSISFPNYRLFHKQQRKVEAEWVVIRLRAAILWELDCAFCQTNAASRFVRTIPLGQRKSVDALKAMFANNEADVRGLSKIPDRYPTDPQAEVLVLEPIPAEYISGIYFKDKTPCPGWKQRKGDHIIPAEVERRVFAPRIDYEHWQKPQDQAPAPFDLFTITA